jgi:hypothetical protein
MTNISLTVRTMNMNKSNKIQTAGKDTQKHDSQNTKLLANTHKFAILNMGEGRNGAGSLER